MEINSRIKTFLTRNQDVINAGNFKLLYKMMKGETSIGTENIPIIPEIFYKVGIDPLKSMTEVPDWFLLYNSNIKEITIPKGINAIGYKSFKESNIEKINIPDSLIEIEESAFARCIKLKSINLNKVENIRARAFELCFNLENVDFDNGLKYIGFAAFKDCSRLKNLKFPNTLKYIREAAFKNCFSLENIYLEKGIENIGNAFYDCRNLKNIYYSGTISDWNDINKKFDREDLYNVTIHCIDGEV